MFFFCGSRFTYEIAPVFVLMEQLTLKKMREIIGWPGGEGDGIFSPGLCRVCDSKKVSTQRVKNVCGVTLSRHTRA